MLVNGTASGGFASALMTTGRPKTHQPPLDDGGNPLVALARNIDPAQAEALEGTIRQGKEAVEQFEAVEKSMRDGRKEAARENVERLKAQLQALRMLAVTDPEAAAREAARLARGLASAVREYVSAGGDASAVGAAAGASAPSGPGTTSEDEDGVETVGEALPLPPVAGDDADAQFIREARLVKQALKDIIEAIKRDRDGDSNARAADLRDADRALRDTDRTLGGSTTGTASASTLATVDLLI
jgi:hypothetical protein